jgi:hypothetical protein
MGLSCPSRYSFKRHEPMRCRSNYGDSECERPLDVPGEVDFLGNRFAKNSLAPGDLSVAIVRGRNKSHLHQRQLAWLVRECMDVAVERLRVSAAEVDSPQRTSPCLISFEPETGKFFPHPRLSWNARQVSDESENIQPCIRDRQDILRHHGLILRGQSRSFFCENILVRFGLRCGLCRSSASLLDSDCNHASAAVILSMHDMIHHFRSVLSSVPCRSEVAGRRDEDCRSGTADTADRDGRVGAEPREEEIFRAWTE